jgi:hypothetical protein
MSSIKQLQLEQKNAAQQRQIILELEAVVKSVERCEKTIIELKDEIEQVNLKHKERRTTEDDIAYLSDLLKCANKKLNWEKQLASLQKRTPAILQKLTVLMGDTKCPPSDQMRASMARALQGVQLAMERLQHAKIAGNLEGSSNQ